MLCKALGRRVASSAPSGGVVIVRIAGEGWWLLPEAAEYEVLQLDNAVSMAVDEAREDEYQRLLVGLCAFVREHGELLESHDHAGDADITVPPPSLPLDSAVDALFDAGGLSAE
jgi:PspA-Associated protein